MGWKGTMRSISAASRRMEKDAQRRHKQAVKAQITADAADAVENWEAYIDELLSVHTDLTDRIDWQKLLDTPEPTKPILGTKHHDKAQSDLLKFSPSMFDFLRGGSAKRKSSLEENLAQASNKDEADHRKSLKAYEAAFADWNADAGLAKRLFAGDPNAIQEVISEMQTLSKNDLIGSSVEFSIGENVVHARPQVHTDEIIPNYRRKQLASGKLSETKMPVGEFNELYQDYVASVALKVASDLFQILPQNAVYVTCENNMLNTTTGHKEATPILSVKFVRETMEELKLDNIDPSDSMKNFKHVMKFSRTKGFSAIKPLEFSEAI